MKALGLALALASPACAQVVSPLTFPTLPLTSDLATKADVAAVSAAIPSPAAAAPSTEAVAPATGTMTTRYALQDHVHPRITRAGTVTTDASGAWSITWSTPLSAVPNVLPVPMNATTQPVVCNVATRTATAATGRCWYARTLPASIALLSNLISYDLFGASASGISVQVVALPPTQ